MHQTLVSKTGEKHGLINTVANSVPDNGFAHMKPEMKTKCEKMRKDDARIVKARYMNHRGQNERLTKPYMRWAGDPIETWHFIPGEEYELPKGLVDEVNDPRKKLAQRSEVLDASGKPTLKDGPGERIHEFVPVGW